jgi:ribonucleoside-diphosphate reductase alpha chain
MSAHRYPQMTDQRRKVFLDRYALRNYEGLIVEGALDEMWKRVSGFVAASDPQARRFHLAMEGFGFVPGGRILSGAHNGHASATLYNCFVIGIRDSRIKIMRAMTRMVEINARGGGVGINWSSLRPEGYCIRGVHGESAGPNCWMKGADGLADQIRQGGSRTAALMFTLDDWHPDAPAFARIKEKFKRANFSMALSDKFMTQVEKGGEWETYFPRTSHPEYDQSWDGVPDHWQGDFLPGPVVFAGDMLRDISESACSIGSPGLVFIDRCNAMSNTSYRDHLCGTNPCGEQPLPENGCCNLGSVNLAAFWDEAKGDIDTEMLADHVGIAVRFLDRVIDVSPYLDSDIQWEQAQCRRVGVGTMGLADYLILKGIRYGSKESIEEIKRIYRMIRDMAYYESTVLAQELGPAPGFRPTILISPFIKSLPEWIKDRIGTVGLRNLTLLTQAPTGTTSTLAGVSSGIEPIFSSRYIRRDATGCHEVVHPLFEGRDDDFLVTAYDISPYEHILVQSTVQRLIDTSVSKTINLPSTATPEDIMGIYRMAYEMGCKGITVYRSGSLGNDVLSSCEACSL